MEISVGGRAEPEGREHAESQQHLSEFFGQLTQAADARRVRAYLRAHGVDIPDGLSVSVTVRGLDQLQAWLR